jgi:autotransporter-associated beta strand protein
LNGGVPDWFVSLDSARFDNTGAANPTVNLVGALPISSVSVDAASDYTFSGTGHITGAGGLTKTNSGKLVMLTDNDYTGRTVIGGGVFEVPDLNVSDSPGPLGSTGVSPTNLVFYSSTFRVTSGQAYTDRGITLASGNTTADISASGALINLAGQIVGAGTLVKTGVGTLILSAANSYSGTIISGGTLQLGSATANTSGLGSGSVVLTNGANLSLFGAGAGDLGTGGAGGPFTASLNVPTATSGSFGTPFRFTINNTLTGGGTLNLGVTGVRGDFSGNWSAFNGTINVSSLSGTSDFRCNNSAGYPNAKINLGSTATWQNRVGGTPTIPVGELSGSAGAAISAPGGNGGVAVNWRVGGLNTTATYAGNTFNSVGFIKEGTGTWIWTGTNISHSGQTTISNGALQIGNGGTVGTLGPGNVTDNAALIFNRSNGINDTNSGVISGNGDVIKRGAGVLTLTKTHTFTGRMSIEAGALAITNSGSIPNASNIVVTNGALLDVSGHTGSTLSLGAGQKMSGNGSIKGGLVMSSGSTLSPGYSIGTLTFSNALTLSAGCTNVFEINPAVVGPARNDAVRVFGALTNGGTLIVTNVGPSTFVNGDSFTLFNAGSYSGSFSEIVLPPLPNGLAWDTGTVNTNGVLKVITAVPPVFTSYSLSADGNIRLSFSGTANQAYEIRATTNLTLAPITSWTLLDTGMFTGSPILFDDLQATNFVRRFYLIRIP